MDAQSRLPTGKFVLAELALLVAEERFEIAVESLQELVDLEDIIDRYRIAWHALVLRFDVSPSSHVLFTQAPQCELGLFSVAVTDNSRDEVARLAFAA